MIIQESPDQKKKRDLAEQMIIQGQSSQPIRSPLQGIANLAKAISGKYQLDKADQSLDTRKADAKQALADALSETDANKRISILSANEDTSPYATQLMLSDLKGGQEIERAKELEKWKMDNTPTEQWTEIKDEKGNVIAQKSSVTGKVVADPRYQKPDWMSDQAYEQQLNLLEKKEEIAQKQRENDPSAVLARQIQEERLETSKLANQEKTQEIEQAKSDEEKGVQIANDALNIVNNLLAPESKENMENATGVIDSMLPTLRQGTADFETDIGRLEAILTKENLGLLKGVMSDSDLALLIKISAGGS
jgi:hypothetical protein